MPFDEPTFEKYVHNEPQSTTPESIADKCLREVQLVTTGLMGVQDGVQESIDHPWATAARAGLAFGLGAAASRYGAAEGLGDSVQIWWSGGGHGTRNRCWTSGR